MYEIKEKKVNKMGYVTAKIPETLASDIDNIVNKKILGYRSRGEFIMDAIREKLLKIKENGGEEQ